MSADHSSCESRTHGLLRGQRAKSYGSLVNSSLSPIHQKRIEHEVQPGETLQGLALKYGVTMEQIKRANRLYTNDSIFLKKYLAIPVLTQSVSFTNENELSEEGSSPLDSKSHQPVAAGNGQTDSESRDVPMDLSPSDYLKKMDGLIHQSKQAAVKTCQEGDKKFSSMEQLQHSGNNLSGCSQRQQAMLGSVPLTITKRTKIMRDREDEIFQL